MVGTFTTWILLGPLVGALIAGFGWRVIGERAAMWLTTGIMGAAAVFAWAVFFNLPAETQQVVLFRWIDSGTMSFDWGVRVDRLTAVMLVVITTVSALVHLYSIGYMEEDDAKPRFFAYLSFFSFAMLSLVTADNLLQLFFGWEGVGVASYLLIGFWWKKPSANAAAIKAFVVNRVGDFGFLLGILTLYVLTESVEFDVIFAAAPVIAETSIRFLWSDWNAAELAALLLFVGAMGKSAQLLLHTWLPDAMEGPTPVSALILGVVGKSAQFPLHTWLPDAMAGPTPVSALIHAATMVTAGVFLVARLYPLYSATPAAQATLAVIGAITLLAAGLLALVQEDIKKVLAYSTVSQLGYMVAALGFSYTAGIFHLFTHGFFKALLFLGAGSIIHAAHSNNMRDMGGLAKVMPRTFGTFLVGTLALMAVPPLAGFWSKDEILVEAAAAGGYTGSLVLVLGAIGGLITVFYMTRLLYLVFAGEFRGHGHPHESPPSMTVPLLALAVPSALIGLANLPVAAFQPYAFSAWTMHSLEYWQTHPIEFNLPVAAVAVALAAAGFVAGRALYRSQPLDADDPMRKLGPATRVLEERYFLDHLWTDLITRYIVRDTAGPVAVAVNDRFIDRIVYWVGAGTGRFGQRLYDIFDQKGIDGALHAVATGTWWTTARVRLAQSGNVQLYAGAMLAGVVVLAVVFAAG